MIGRAVDMTARLDAVVVERESPCDPSCLCCLLKLFG
jgi:hypothetical protein